LHEAYDFKDMIFGEEIAGTGSEILPNEFKLYVPYPNPFNPVTTIRFSVGSQYPASLRIYDLNGRLVETLANKKLNAGEHEIVWNADGMASGMYIVKLVSGEQRQIQKLILLK
jgi:hypothetical protein